MKNNPPAAPRYDLLTPSIFFTPLSLMLTTGLLFVALLYGQKDMGLLSLVMLLGAISLKLWSIVSAREIQCRLFTDRQKLFPGESVVFHINIKNNKLLPIFIKVKWRIDGFLQADGGNTWIEEESGLLSYQGILFHRECIAQKRGFYRIGAPTMATGDLFGFFPRDRTEKNHLDILVYPRRVPIKPFPLLKRITFGKPGEASPVRDPLYIFGTRDYQPSRPSRYIHWKASARHYRLQEKIFEPAEQDKVLLALDVDGFQAHGADDEFEKAIEVLASLAAELEARHYAIGFISNTGSSNDDTVLLSIARKTGQLTALLEILAKLEFRPTRKRSELVNTVEKLPADAICVYFSYEPYSGKPYDHRRRLPTMNIVCRPVADTHGQHETYTRTAVFYLKDIRVTA